MSELFNLKAIREQIMLSGGFEVDNSALQCPNPEEWYTRAYLRDSYEDFRVIPNLKEAKKIANQEFGDGGSVLYEFDCDWTEGDAKLSTVTIEACPYSVMHSICQRDLETSFVVDSMVGGNEGWKNEANFFNHYWDRLADKVGEDLAITKWQGHTASGFVCTGLEERIITASASNDVTPVGASAISVANIESYFEDLLISLKNTVARKKTELRFYVSPVNANKIAISMAKNNTTNYVTTELGLTYAGIKISVQEGMSDDIIVLTRKSNLIIGVDALGDSKNLKVRDLDVINVPKIRTRVDGKFATLIVNEDEINFIKI